jgi:hypothetical protein
VLVTDKGPNKDLSTWRATAAPSPPPATRGDGGIDPRKEPINGVGGTTGGGDGLQDVQRLRLRWLRQGRRTRRGTDRAHRHRRRGRPGALSTLARKGGAVEMRARPASHMHGDGVGMMANYVEEGRHTGDRGEAGQAHTAGGECGR